MSSSGRQPAAVVLVRIVRKRMWVGQGRPLEDSAGGLGKVAHAAARNVELMDGPMMSLQTR